MQTEKLPTNIPPPAPPSSNGSQPDRGPRTPTEWEKYSNRILVWCFAASILINIGFGIWLSFADIYGEKRTADEQKVMKIRVYRPPVKVKPKPKPKPPPPKKIIPPKPIKMTVKPPPPRIQPRVPPPPAPRAPSVGHTVHSNTPQAVNVGPVTQAPPVAVPQTPGIDTRPQAPIVAPPAPPPPVIEKPAPPPVVQKPPPPPAPPPPLVKPKPPPDRVDPEQISGSFSDITLPSDLDVSTLNSTNVTVTWEVDEQGRSRNIKFRPTGNSDVDQAIRDAVSRFRYKPRMINGVAESVNLNHTFTIG